MLLVLLSCCDCATSKTPKEDKSNKLNNNKIEFAVIRLIRVLSLF